MHWLMSIRFVGALIADSGLGKSLESTLGGFSTMLSK